jgi:hypothetical protein
MDKLDLNSLTKEQIEKAMACNTPEELIALAKTEGIEITLEQAEAYLEELQDVELNQETLDKVAGGMDPRGCHHLSQWR